MTTGTVQDTAQDPTGYSQAAFPQEEASPHLRQAESEGRHQPLRFQEHRPAGMPLSAGHHPGRPLQECRQVPLQGSAHQKPAPRQDLPHHQEHPMP